MNFCFGLACLAALLAAAAPLTAQPVVLTVDTGQVVRADADRFVGIDLNYIRDSDANRPGARPLDAALKDMGAGWLRYPGGEKSDFSLWAEPPYTTPHPVGLGYYATVAGTRMDLDEYVAHCRAVRAEPYVVAGYDSEARTGRTEAQWLQSAVAEVRYANVTKKYGIRYWEIGNENWHNGTATPEEMAGVVVRFSRAMKAVDPTIHIGASGSGAAWWSQFLPTAAPALDFLTLSLYNVWGWKSYDHFVQHPEEDTIGDVRTALAAIDKDAPPADRARLRVIVAETNSKDYSEGGWAGTNTLGHALVTWDTLGKVMTLPRVSAAMVWTTRWMDDGEAKRSQWYALGPQNELLPTGRAVALWGQFLHNGGGKDRVAVSGGSGAVSAAASRSRDGRAVTVWVLNRGLEAAEDVQIVLKSPVSFRQAALFCLSGTGPDDADPHWGAAGTRAVMQNTVRGLSCPGVSVTVLVLKP